MFSALWSSSTSQYFSLPPAVSATAATPVPESAQVKPPPLSVPVNAPADGGVKITVTRVGVAAAAIELGVTAKGAATVRLMVLAPSAELSMKR